jgi:hypothetical protein
MLLKFSDPSLENIQCRELDVADRKDKDALKT